VSVLHLVDIERNTLLLIEQLGPSHDVKVLVRSLGLLHHSDSTSCRIPIKKSVVPVDNPQMFLWTHLCYLGHHRVWYED